MGTIVKYLRWLWYAVRYARTNGRASNYLVDPDLINARCYRCGLTTPVGFCCERCGYVGADD